MGVTVQIFQRWMDMSTSSQFVKEYINLTKNRLDTYLDVIVYFICRESPMPDLLWLGETSDICKNSEPQICKISETQICRFFKFLQNCMVEIHLRQHIFAKFKFLQKNIRIVLVKSAKILNLKSANLCNSNLRFFHIFATFYGWS